MPRSRAAQAEATGTRERLIATTATHLARFGPRGVELRAICVELGISPSLVNYHFRSAGELLWLAAVHGYSTHVEAQQSAVSTSPDGATALERWLRGTIEWKRDSAGVAAVIDYPMLAFSADEAGELEELSKQISALSRANVASLASAVLATMTDRPVRMISAQRAALLIKTNREFAFWTTLCGFGGQGAATWIAGRRPYGALWKMFGFNPDKQTRSTVLALVERVAGAPQASLVDLTDIAEAAEQD